MTDLTKKRVLVVEDEPHLSEGLKLNLSLKGYDVMIAPDGSAALRRWKEWAPDLIVLDIMLPKIDGLSVLRKIRLEDERIPILIRVERLATRGGWTRERADSGEREISSLPRFYEFGENRIDFQTLEARCPSGQIRLTEQEAMLLRLFINNRGRPLSRKKLLEIGWGYARGTTTRTVDNFIVRFRKYFERDPKNPVYFKSLRSVGYIFDHEPEKND